MGIGAVGSGTGQVELSPDAAPVTDTPAAPPAQVSTGHEASSGFDAASRVDGPSGTVSYAGKDYTVDHGQVFDGEKSIGTVNDSGHFTGVDGQTLEVADLIGAHVDGRLSSGQEVHSVVERASTEPRASLTGQVQVNGTIYFAEKGEVYDSAPGVAGQRGVKVGTVSTDPDGQISFKVKVGGVESSGKLNDLAAVYALWPGDRPQPAGPFSSLLKPTPAMTAKIEADRAAQGLKTDEFIDAFGNKALSHRNAKGETDGYQILEYAEGNLKVGADGKEVKAITISTNSMYPEKNFIEYDDGSRKWWDGKTLPALPSRVAAQAAAEASGASPAVVAELKKTYRDAIGADLNQGQLELFGYTKSVQQPEYMALIRDQAAALTDRFKALGREPTQREREYWVTVSTDLDLMRRGLASLKSKSNDDFEAVSASLKKLPPIVHGAPAGDLPATPTKQGLMGRKMEQDIADERKPLVKPDFVKTAADAEAFERLRKTSLATRGVDLTSVNADWAKQMLASGAASASNLAQTSAWAATIKQAYEKAFPSPRAVPTERVLNHLLPFTANLDANQKQAAEALSLLQDKQRLSNLVEILRRRGS